MRMVALILAMLAFPSCQSLERLIGGREASIPGEKRQMTAIVWGQSNATDTFLWAELGRYFEMRGITLTTVNVAIGGTDSAYWRDHHDEFIALVSSFQPTFVFCIQGEGDGATTATQYRDNMATVLQAVRAASPKTISYMALCSYAPSLQGQGDPRGGQLLLAQMGLTRLGPDVDLYRTPNLSRDAGLHFNLEGNKRIAEAWWDIIEANW